MAAHPAHGRYPSGKAGRLPLSVPIYLVYREARRSPSGIHWSQRVYHNTSRATVWVPANTKVRVHHEPEFDAKGRPVRSTPRSDPSDPDRRLGGKRGTTDDLRPGQAVRVSLQRNRDGLLFAATIVVLNELPRR